MATINKVDNTNSGQGYRKLELLTLLMGCKTVNMFLAYDPAIKLLGIYPRKMKTHVHLKANTNTDNCLKLEKKQISINWQIDE